MDEQKINQHALQYVNKEDFGSRNDNTGGKKQKQLEHERQPTPQDCRRSARLVGAVRRQQRASDRCSRTRAASNKYSTGNTRSSCCCLLKLSVKEQQQQL